jgi:hypothetical protein
VQRNDLIVAEEKRFERLRELGRLRSLEEHAFILDDVFEGCDEEGALNFDHVDLERGLSGDGLLFMIFDFEDLDRDSVVGFGDFDVQLLWWCLDPVVATSTTVLAFVECLNCRASTEILNVLGVSII